jgi:hypothetical protein
LRLHVGDTRVADNKGVIFSEAEEEAGVVILVLPVGISIGVCPAPSEVEPGNLNAAVGAEPKEAAVIAAPAARHSDKVVRVATGAFEHES